MARRSAADAPIFAICPSRSKKSCAGCSRHCGWFAPENARDGVSGAAVAMAVGVVITGAAAGTDDAGSGDLRDSVRSPPRSVRGPAQPTASSARRLAIGVATAFLGDAFRTVGIPFCDQARDRVCSISEGSRGADEGSRRRRLTLSCSRSGLRAQSSRAHALTVSEGAASLTSAGLLRCGAARRRRHTAIDAEAAPSPVTAITGRRRAAGGRRHAASVESASPFLRADVGCSTPHCSRYAAARARFAFAVGDATDRFSDSLRRSRRNACRRNRRTQNRRSCWRIPPGSPRTDRRHHHKGRWPRSRSSRHSVLPRHTPRRGDRPERRTERPRRTLWLDQ